MLKTAAFEKYTAYSKSSTSETSEKTNLIDESRKFGNLMKSEHSINRPILVNFNRNKKHFETIKGSIFNYGIKTFYIVLNKIRFQHGVNGQSQVNANQDVCLVIMGD